ncbi:hypothetical protein [Agarilytica rhodophyticola]|uniref:hypothetical protein n=1 Tax=Agarilytica rhodophyticola TaxID=1737490 RepID=UPI00131A4923|nr:hypothetical protein [Agarilytica rhodophyticola]
MMSELKNSHWLKGMTRNNQKDAENIEKATELILDTIKQMDLAPTVGALNHD